MADGKVTIDTQLDNTGFERGLKSMDKGLGGLKTTLLDIGKTIATVFAVREIVQFGKACIELGSNVAEVQNVVNVAFGDMAYKVENFAATAIENFGMSTLAAKKTASNYMAMARGMGVAMDAASEMSIALTGLSGDVASFYNITQEEAAYKLQSIFTGETESLKELGVVMTQVNLQQYAMEHGWNTNIQAMTQAERVALNYAYVTDQLALASGDFVRTQDSWANQTRILSMQWQEFMSIIGQALTTILLPLVRTLNTIVSSLISMASVFGSAITAMFGGEATQAQQTQAAVSGVASGISEAVDNQNALTKATKATNKEQSKSLASFDQINKLASESAASSGGGGGAGGVGGIGGGISIPTIPAGVGTVEKNLGKLPELFKQVQTALEPLRTSFDVAFSSIEDGALRIVEAFQTAWGDLKSLSNPILQWAQTDLVTFLGTYIETIGTMIGGIMDTVGMMLETSWSTLIFPTVQKFVTDILPILTQFGTLFYQTVGNLFQEVKKIFDMIWMDAVVPAMEIVQQVWSDVWDSVISVWEKHGQPIFDGINEAINKVGEILDSIWNTIISPVLDYAMEKFSQVWDESLHPLVENVLEFAAILGETALAVLNNFILPVVGWFVDSFGPSIGGVLENIIDGFFGLVRFVSDAVNSIVTVAKGFLQIIKGIFTGDFGSVLEGFENIFKGAFNFVIGIFEGFVNFFIRGINTIIGGLNSLSFSVPDWVPGIGGNRFGVNIGKISEIRLPRLATGGVVPRSHEFAAILGDNKQETEVVSPLSTMRQAMLEALEEAGGIGGGTIELVVNLDGKTVARNTVKHINSMTRSAGKPVLVL